jgi:DNA-binding MarR family transcriptional regulator
MSKRFVLHESTGFLVGRVTAAMETALRRELEPHGVTVKQWALLVASVDREEAPTLSELGEQLGVDPGAVTRLADRLERKKLLRRRADAGDRRALRVELTAKGRSLAETLPPLARGVLETFHRGMSPAQVETLHRLLRQLLANAPD